MGHSSKMPWLYEFRSSETFIVLVVAIAIFTDTFIYGMVVPIIPVALVERAGAREEDAQSWVSIMLAVYGGTLLIGSPLFGWFADHTRFRRLPFIIGLIALGASTFLFVIARSMPILIIARGLQGLSAAAVWVVGLAIVSDNVPTDRVGEATGYTTIALTWGFLLGPTIGGIMYEKVGFYWTFAMPAALIVVDVLLRFAMIEASEATEHDRNMRAENEHAPLLRSRSNESDTESTTEQPATIFDLLKSPRLPLACIATLVMAVVFSALETTLPLYVMETFNWSSAGAGLIFVASSIPSFLGVHIGKMIPHLGVRLLATSAFLVASIAWILMRLVTHSTTNDVILLTALLLIEGLAIVTVEVTSTTEASAVVADYEEENPGVFGDKSPVAQAYALFNMAFAGGQLLGPILAGGMRVHTGWSGMTLILGVICAVTAVPLGLFSGPRRRGGEVGGE